MVLELGFSQVCQSKEVRDYMERARKLCVKHFDILSSMLKEENLHVPRLYETEVTDSTVPPFSDKLMLFHIVTLLSAAIAYYSEALSMGQRRDLTANYARMNTEIALIAEDGLNLLIRARTKPHNHAIFNKLYCFFTNYFFINHFDTS
ncbi:hypothetical protein BkAM31D_16290 [Halalkalibacter krulwichiae]|uniref:Uncharacterized protein n=1 Tax=Halalkalibacter krulwichiae TaxID=199441 RepID=A0A1X9MCY0_9BACI|nr:hypothetical protein BkAM31D_16290 [Halalkalibacter krulwichiae]